MRYFGFLARFVVLPLAVLSYFWIRGARRGEKLPPELRGVAPAAALAGHVALAVAYTTPWDNYLVKSRVWWYDRKLVNGLVLGYVPIEEYSFFVLQTLLTGMWVLNLAKTTPHDQKPPVNPTFFRFGMVGAIGAIWLASVFNLFRGPKSRTYLSLVLSWALIPVMIQVAFGGDILWQHRRLVALGIIPSTLYLAASDSLAIDAGTWTINPEKTVNFLIGGRLPLEEGLFFFLTNVLITFGMTLVLSKESQRRVPEWLKKKLGLK